MTTTKTTGRKMFEVDSRVRILGLDGKVSREVYLITEDRVDRKGFIALKEEGSSPGTPRLVRVAQRRILPVNANTLATVVESGDKFKAICPKCGRTEDIDPSVQHLLCPACGQFPLYWIGVQPTMSADTKSAKKPTAAKANKAAPKERPAKASAPQKVDFHALKRAGELWTKKNVKFDHHNVDVQSHCLIIDDGDDSRKLCFNTYDGTLGKRANLPIESFVSGKKTEKTIPWYPVKDVSKLRKSLAAKNYEKA